MSKKSIEDTKENIELVKKLYYDERMTYTQVAKELHIGADALRHFMVRNNIERRTTGETKLLKFSEEDKLNIVKLYINENLSTEDISKIYNVDRQTIANYLKRNNIDVVEFRKDNMTEKAKNHLDKIKKVTLSNKELIDLYCNQKSSASDIARRFDATPRTVFQRLENLNIKTRNLKEMLNEESEFRETHIKRFVKNMRNEKSNNKRIKTNLERYGVDNPFKLNYFQNKAFKTRFEIGLQKSSRQQRYLCNLFNGSLNYLVGNSFLDIAFPNEKTYIEYDGSGHKLNIKFGKISEQDFYAQERRRWYFLRSKGWKEIRIISGSKDLLPQDNIIIKLINEAKEYLNTGHGWIEYNIDESKVICSQYEKDYDFGVLRRIHKSNLENIS